VIELASDPDPYKISRSPVARDENQPYARLHNLPAGHWVHPSVPLMKGLENVPRGQGNNLQALGETSILLNPEARRAEMRYRLSSE